MSALVASGRIKVDARRAREKLREHLLVDLHLYTLEIVRSAVASGATAIDLRYDADEVELTWDGEPFAASALSSLLDHVLGEGHTREGRRLRLLALGVNAALGLDPEYVDIVATDDAGRATRTRWTTAMLKEDGADAKAESIEPHPPMDPRRTRVYVKKRLGLAVIRRVLGEQPREVVLLADATHDLGVELRANGEPFERAPRPRALARAPIEIRGARRAVLEILPAQSTPMIEWLEEGVCLIRSLRAPFGFGSIPARIVVDVEELPTNASRSALREDAAIVGLVAAAAEVALVDVEAMLAARVMREEIADMHGVEWLDASDEEIEETLGAFVSSAASQVVAGRSLLPSHEKLLDLPLLRDGAGAQRTARSVLDRAREGMSIWVWRAPVAVDAELAPWMQDALWLSGRAVERFVDGLSSVDAGPLLELAKAGLDRKKRLLAHAPGPVVLPPSQHHVARDRFAIRSGEFAGLEGEVALVAVPPLAPSRVRIFVSQRAIATISIPRETLPLALDIAFAWDRRFTVLFDWSGVEIDTSFRAAVWRASRVGVALASLVAAKLDAMTQLEREHARSILRSAIGASVVCRAALGLPEAPRVILADSLPALWKANVWPTTDVERFVSLADLWAYASKTHAICVTGPNWRGVAADGRPVLAVESRELVWAFAALGGDIRSVPYESALVRQEPLERDRRRANALRACFRAEIGDAHTTAQSGTVAAMMFERPGRIGIIGVSAIPALIELHAERRLSRVVMKPTLGAVVVVVDDDEVVPDRTWTSVLYRRDASYLRKIERDLCETIVLALEGDQRARARFGPLMPESPGGVSGALLVYLIDSATALRRFEESADRALRDRIEALPILDMIDANRVVVGVSLSWLRDHSKMGEVVSFFAVLERVPDFDTLDWRPILVPTAYELQALDRWAPGLAIRSEGELPARRQRAMREAALRELLTQPALDPRSPGERADPAVPAMWFAAGVGEPSVALGLPRVAGDAGIIELLVEGRRVREIVSDLPAVARVEGSLAYLEPQEEGRRDGNARVVRPGVVEAGDAIAHAVRARVTLAAISLCAERAKEASKDVDATVRGLWDTRVVALLIAILRMPSGGEEQSARRDLELALRQRVLWPTAQGGASLLTNLRVVEGEISVAFARYASWVGPSRGRAELDFPVLWAPRNLVGDSALALVRALGVTPRDVSEELAKLQAHRSRATKRAAPRLAGEAAFPALRVTFDHLGTFPSEGELEVIEAGPSYAQVVDIDGIVRKIDVALPIPLRLIATIDSVEITRDVTNRLASAATARAKQLLQSLAPKLDELPELVRTHLRRILCEELEPLRKMDLTDHFAVFPDVAGGFHSLAEISGKDAERRAAHQPAWPCTREPPPYPKVAIDLRVLRLSDLEANALVAAGVALNDANAWVREARFGEARASASPFEVFALDPKQRSKCLWTTQVDGDVSGEVGVLAPANAAAHGILLHTTRRPLCLVDDAPGWPLLAVVNDDRLRPSPSFDALAVTADGARVSAAVREAGDACLRAAIHVPDGVLATRFVNETFATSEGAIVITGALWINAVWPAAPVVLLRTPSGDVKSALVTFHSPSPLLAGTIAIDGELLVAPTTGGALLGAHREGIAALAQRVLAELVAEARAAKAPLDALEAYATSLALLGHGDARFPIGGGGDVGHREVFAEIAARAVVWWSASGGTADGDFPGVPPAFVLTASPALEVLRARIAPAALRELGGLAGRSAAAVAVAPEAPQSSRDDAFAADSVGILDRVRGAIAALFASEEEAPPSAPSLRQALLIAINRLHLTGMPVVGVKHTKRGRPVRYEKSTKHIYVNREHPLLAGRTIASGPGLAMLVAVAVAEVNRALTEVTDAEEARALRSMIAESS